MSKAIGCIFDAGSSYNDDDEEKKRRAENQALLDEYIKTAEPSDNNSYPVVRSDKRGLFNSTVENFVKSNQISDDDTSIIGQISGAARDLGENYINMVNANLQSNSTMQDAGTTIDNYYHCIGNYEAAQRGNIGSATAATIGLGRELTDYMRNLISKKSFTEANQDFKNDLAVNSDGRDMAQSDEYNSAFDACEKYRPEEYDPLERWKYYRNRYKRNRYRR